MLNYKIQQPKRLPPKRRVEADWCSSGGTYLKELTDRGIRYTSRKRAEAYGQQDYKRVAQANSQDGRFTMLHDRFQGTFVRCPGCGRRLHPKMPDYGDDFEGFVLPKHKTK